MSAATQVAALPADLLTTAEESPWRVVARRFARHRMAVLSIFIIVAIFTISVLARYITPFTLNELAVGNYFLPFGAVEEATERTHYLGTDNIGRDYFSRLIYAGRISLTVAILSVAISTTIGIMVA